MELVYDFLNNDIKLNSNDIIVVGVSAGPDSMTLLYILSKIRKSVAFKIIVAHVNHNVRVESKEEAEFLKNYCEKNNLVFEMMTIHKYAEDNFHNEARNIRYTFYKELVEKYHANYLMTGHHGDDLMETILMRIVRGSTLKGYSGFSSIVDMGSYKIIRPLIFMSKDAIKDFALHNKIPFRIDKSNESDKYTRNRYRKNVLPFLKSEDNNVHLKFLKYSKTLMEYDKYIDNIVLKELSKVYYNKRILVDKFLLLDNLIQKKIIDYLLAELYLDDLLQIDDRHVELILKLINSKKANMQYNLPNNYVVIKAYNEVYFKRVVDDINVYDIELSKEVYLPNGMRIVKIDKCELNDNSVLRLHAKDVFLPLHVRTRKIGDKFYGKNMQGIKKLSELFIDCKVPKEDRDAWPVVVDAKDNIIWIPKLKKTKYNGLKDDDCDIIFKCY